jgi:hypothetical protein
MKVRVQADGFSPAQILDDAQSVVVYDDHGQPIIAIQHVQEGQILLVKADDPNFSRTIGAFGIGLNARVVLGHASRNSSDVQS